MSHFSIVTAPGAVRKPARALRATGQELSLVAQTLLVPILPHAFSTLMFGDFRLAFFLERTHQRAIQAFAAPNCNLVLC